MNVRMLTTHFNPTSSRIFRQFGNDLGQIPIKCSQSSPYDLRTSLRHPINEDAPAAGMNGHTHDHNRNSVEYHNISVFDADRRCSTVYGGTGCVNVNHLWKIELHCHHFSAISWRSLPLSSLYNHMPTSGPQLIKRLEMPQNQIRIQFCFI